MEMAESRAERERKQIATKVLEQIKASPRGDGGIEIIKPGGR